MSKTITSDIKGFTGTFDLPDYLTLPQVLAWARATRQVEQTPDMKRWEVDAAVMPVAFTIIERMVIEQQPEHPTLETFRFTPAPRADQLISLIVLEITKLVMTERVEVPNA